LLFDWFGHRVYRAPTMSLTTTIGGKAPQVLSPLTEVGSGLLPPCSYGPCVALGRTLLSALLANVGWRLNPSGTARYTPSSLLTAGLQGPGLEEHPGVRTSALPANVVPSSPCPSGQTLRLVIARPLRVYG